MEKLFAERAKGGFQLIEAGSMAHIEQAVYLGQWQCSRRASSALLTLAVRMAV